MLHRAAAYCSAAERCIQDVEKKVRDAGLPPEAADRIIKKLQAEKFLDETRFARFFVNDKLRFNKWGRIKIGYELRRKNIPGNIREEALDGIDEKEYNSILLSLLKEKKRTIRSKNHTDGFYKLLRFAAGRGFENTETIRCLKQLDFTEDYENNYESFDPDME